MTNEKLTEQLNTLKDACAKWEKELAIYTKWALENDGVLSAAEKQVIEARKADIEAIQKRIVQIEKEKGIYSPSVLVDKDGNIIYTPTNKIEARPFKWKKENNGTWKRKVHLAKEVYYYTNKGRKLYAYQVFEIYFEIAPNDPYKNEPYITELDKKLVNVQSLWDSNKKLTNYPVYQKRPDSEPIDVHIVSDIVNHHYFYDRYNGPRIAYTVWESTILPSVFFDIIKNYYNQIWAASAWQKDCMVAQGIKPDKIEIVPAGVDSKTFFPEEVSFEKYYSDGRFKFVLFGRWSSRKATKDIIKTFLKTFNKDEPVDIIVSVDNPFPDDQYKSTYERLKGYELEDERIKVIHFPSREDYVKFIKKGHVFVSCSRGEGWNLPLIEAMACGTPAIYSNCSAQLEFASGKGHPVNIAKEVPNTIENTGNYYEPDWDHLSKVFRDTYQNYDKYKVKALQDSVEIREKFDWQNIGEIGFHKIQNFLKNHNIPRKKKILFVAPNLMGGKMSCYLEEKIKLLMEDFDIFCLDYHQYSSSDDSKIEDILGNRFYTLKDLPKEKILDIIYEIEPDIIHFEEFVEMFVDNNILKKIYPWYRNYVIIETSQGTYFDPNNKKFFPDKYVFVDKDQLDFYSTHDVSSEIVTYQP